MNKKEIVSFSLQKLIDVCGHRPEDLYFEGCLVASQLKMEDNVAFNLFRYPVRMNAYAIAFCSKGAVTITSNLNHFTLNEGDLYINLPGSILQVESVDHAEVFIVACEEEFIRQINVDLKLLTRLFFLVERHPLLRLPENEWFNLRHSFEEIDKEEGFPTNDVYSVEVLRTTLRLIIYKVCRIISRHVESKDTPAIHTSRHEEYFHKFMRLLEENYLQERSVGFYATAMSLTPKYLTTIIREASGRTAISWIDAYVILEAKNLLKYSTMSIQEISYYLNFSNQSFFGKYFKNHTGMTPTAYRMNN